jgi:hypothetical protein
MPMTCGRASDLFAKLLQDRKRMRRDRGDPYVAWDFFVTAEHLGEWHDTRCPLRHGSHGGDGYLLLACHIAIGSKHFRVKQATRPVDAVIDRAGVFQRGVFDPRIFDVGGLAVTHSGMADLPAGTLPVAGLADRVIEIWRDHLGWHDMLARPQTVVGCAGGGGAVSGCPSAATGYQAGADPLVQDLSVYGWSASRR